MLRELEERLLFPAPQVPLRWLQAQAQAQEATELRLTTSDGVALYGWHLTAQGARRGVVIWFEGNGGSLGMRPREFEVLRAEGWDVVQANYRGYPGSEGRPSEAGLRRDAQAMWDYAAGLDPRVWLIGKSLGGGVAIGLAAERPAALLTVESTFTNIPAVAEQVMAIPLGFMVHNRFDSIRLTAQVHAPSLVLHGEADTLIPVQQGRDLAEALQAPFIGVPGAGHNDALLLDHWEEVRRWATAHLGG